jgi:hypothetical protein
MDLGLVNSAQFEILQIFHLLSLKYNEFQMNFYTVNLIIIYIKIFCLNFLETFKCHF